jgi:sugar/nucleoside kinase (ribokinase family)
VSEPAERTRVVVVGAASRDLAADDQRGWRLGGAVTFASLVLARLGLRVIALLGADPQAAAATELDLLRAAGVDLRVVPLAHGPVFENVETPAGRVQRVLDVADPLPSTSADVPAAQSGAVCGWFLGPLTGELDDSWAARIPHGSPVALGWQGLLRSFGSDGSVRMRAPEPSAILGRAELVGVSSDDLAPDTSVAELRALLAPDATLVLTNGAGGGLAMGPTHGGLPTVRTYPAVPSSRTVDVTGAGDTFLAALFASRVAPRLVGGRTEQGIDLLLAAAAASLVVEDRGLGGVPTGSAIRERMRAGLASRGRQR